MSKTASVPKEQVTREAPGREEPMEAVAARAVVSRQPTAEPKPEMTRLRGGGFQLGFDCCGGACRFHKRCC